MSLRTEALAALAALLLAAAAGCGERSVWNVIDELNGGETVAFAAETPRAPASQPALRSADLPCLKSCHDREKWAKGKPYPHEAETHQDNPKRCTVCHAMGHRSAKADRKICADCH